MIMLRINLLRALLQIVLSLTFLPAAWLLFAADPLIGAIQRHRERIPGAMKQLDLQRLERCRRP